MYVHVFDAKCTHILRRCFSIWDNPQQAAHCGYCHGTQTTDSTRVCDCLLSVRAAIMTVHAWTTHESLECSLYVTFTWVKQHQPPCMSFLSSLPWSLPVIYSPRLRSELIKTYTSCHTCFNFTRLCSGLPMLHSDRSPPLAFTCFMHRISIFMKYLNVFIWNLR